MISFKIETSKNKITIRLNKNQKNPKNKNNI